MEAVLAHSRNDPNTLSTDRSSDWRIYSVLKQLTLKGSDLCSKHYLSHVRQFILLNVILTFTFDYFSRRKLEAMRVNIYADFKIVSTCITKETVETLGLLICEMLFEGL